MVVLNLNIGPSKDEHVDGFGHIGGLCTGILLGFAIVEILDALDRNKGVAPLRFTEKEYEERMGCCKNWFFDFIFCALSIIWFIVLICVFCFVTNVNVEQGDIDDPDS